MGMMNDFKAFAFKGNVVDLAVGVIIGAAFGKIVTSIVENLIMPIVSFAIPNGNWREGGLVLRPEVKDAAGKVLSPSIVIHWGAFLGSVVDFFIIALVLFLIVSKLVKAVEGRFAKKDAVTKECPACLESIAIKAKRCKYCTTDLVVT